MTVKAATARSAAQTPPYKGTSLRRVDVYPAVLVPDRPWHDDRGADGFLRSARSVCEVLTDALTEAPALPSTSTLLRLWVMEDSAMPATGPVTARIPWVERRPMRDSWEGAQVVVPSDVADLDPAERRLLVLDVVEHVLRTVAPCRGWASSAVDDLLERARTWRADLRSVEGMGDELLVYRWASAEKTSPNRRYTARAVYRIADDGFGRAAIEVRRGADDGLVAMSKEGLAFHTREGLHRSAKTLRWNGVSRVQLDTYSAPYVVDDGRLTLDLTAGGPPAAPETPPPAGTAARRRIRPAVVPA